MRPHIAQQITFLRTHNPAVTARFYVEVWGFTLELDQRTCPIYQVSNGGYLAEIQRSLHRF